MSEIKILKHRGVTPDGEVVFGNVGESRAGHEGLYIHDIKDSLHDSRRIIPESLAMQTGIADSNGVDIYGSLPGTRGGDVVEYWGEGEYIEPDDEEFEYQDGYRALVVYHGGRGYPAFDIEPPLDCDSNGLSHLIATGRIVVIGNAFQNPELLEAQE